jgi:hypothetical protein
VKYLIFLIILLFSCCNSYAIFTNFDFKLDKYYAEDNKEINVQLIYSFEGYTEEDFLIRPVISNGIIEILNEENGRWISSYGLLTEFPSLENNILVKLTGLNVEKIEIFFEVRNIKTGEVFLTPKKYVWGTKVYENYLERLKISKNEDKNQEISENEGLESSSSNNTKQTGLENTKSETFEDIFNKIPKIFFLILGIVAFSVSFVVGYHNHIDFLSIFRKKKRISMNGKIY